MRIVRPVLILLLIFLSMYNISHAQNLVHLSGCFAGFNEDGEPATLSEEAGVTGMAIDRSGNLYIADQNNNVVRKINASTGIIKTVAGNTYDWYEGDNVPATNTSLYGPQGVALDSSGNIYIADNQNGRVRKVNPITGIITTVVGDGSGTYTGDGGPADSAGVSPTNVALDRVGNIYIADANHMVVRKVTAATGIITTIAGNTATTLPGGPGSEGPEGLVVDTVGNVYFTNGSFILKISAGTGIQSIVIDTGILYSPYGLALDANNNLYIADQGANRVFKYSIGSGILTSIAGSDSAGYAGDGGPADSARLDYPTAVTVDAAGNLYISDYVNLRIRMVSAATHIITTIAGDGLATFCGDGGPALTAQLYDPQGMAKDSMGNLYIADQLNEVVRRIDAVTGIITTIAGTPGVAGFSGDSGLATRALLYWPVGVAVDKSGNIYIADQYNGRIRKVAAGTGIITTIAGMGQFGNYNGDSIPATSAGLGEVETIAIDYGNNLYLADGIDRVRKIDLSTGLIYTVAGNGLSGFGGDGGSAIQSSLSNPWALAIDRFNNVYIADELNNRIRKVTASTGIINTIAGCTSGYGGSNDSIPATTTQLMYITGVSVDGAGNVFLSEDGHIRRIDPVTGIMYIVSGKVRVTIPEIWDSVPLDTTTIGANTIYGDVKGNIYISVGGPNIQYVTDDNEIIGAMYQCYPSVYAYTFAGTTCADTFRAYLSDQTASPSYQWYKNGVPIGTGDTYIANSFNINDSVWVVMTGSFCGTMDTIVSNHILISDSCTNVNAGMAQVTTETLNIQPNPAHDRVLISAGSDIRSLSITDVMGQQVMNTNSLNSMSMNIDISAFDSGVYFVTVHTDRGLGVAKLVVER